MTARRVARLGTALALVLAASTLSGLPAVSAEAPKGTRSSSATSAPVSRAAGTTKPWTPRAGVLFNNPLGRGSKRYLLVDHITKAIHRAHRRSTIDVMSWNIMSRSGVDALIGAQRRGVTVRVLMDDSNRTEIPNPSFRRLQSTLQKNNARWPQHRHSYARTCRGSCRGPAGQAHAKFYLFSRTGTAKHVTIQGSANLTAASATNQWNDVYTFINNPKVWWFGRTVFKQMWKDKKVAQPFVESVSKSARFYFSPLGGPKYKGDPYQNMLQRVRCTGARKAGNERGRTIVRVAPDVIRNDRGMRAARQFKRMYNQGCDIKVGYTVMGKGIYRYLRAKTGRGPVPIKHLVQDFNGDGEFDNYFHLKSISINGRIGDNPTAHVVINGSSNLSGLATVSDENIAIMWSRGLTIKYQKHINYWYDHFPKSVPLRVAYRGTKINPYAHVDMD